MKSITGIKPFKLSRSNSRRYPLIGSVEREWRARDVWCRQTQRLSTSRVHLSFSLPFMIYKSEAKLTKFQEFRFETSNLRKRERSQVKTKVWLNERQLDRTADYLPMYSALIPVSYTHLTLPTNREV
eukprot:TRINITY_DN11343_c0_g1_i1.p1 TRINITY_DN11343_c0_g1~~TRINITY_DN11343_c0_g1_i1.p1  ORF type:complete len:127 (-),score=7.14 TRINITY_DN11343_c0_g1_i1:34-414(-)